MNRFPQFLIFIGIFLSIYGLLHFYFYRKVMKAFQLGTVSHFTFIGALLVLLVSPIIINLMAETEYFTLTRIFAYLGYVWMGALFLFLSINVLIDVYRLIVYVSAKLISPSMTTYLPGPRLILIASVTIITCIIIYGRFEAANITVEKVRIPTEKLPAHVNRLRIVQISDLHLGTINGLGMAHKIGRAISDLRPDLLVSTGDLIERGLQQKEQVASVFRQIGASFGKYAVPGNHEFIGGNFKEAVAFTRAAGFKMLRDEVVKINDFMQIAAVDDPAKLRFGIDPGKPEKIVIQDLLPGYLKLLLKHQPRVEANSIGKFDIQLSGHTHKGQIFPFTLVVGLFYPYQNGLHMPGPKTYLYVSAGTGTWGPPIRFLARPEITVIDFEKAPVVQ